MLNVRRIFLDPNPFSPKRLQFEATCWFLLALCWFWLGAWNHGIWDRDEARFATATAEMIRTGNWIVPHFNGDVRYDKPILIYWLMAIPMSILGPTEFAARAVSGFGGACLTVLLLIFSAQVTQSQGAARFSAFCTMMFVMINIISRAATVDGVLVPVITFMVYLYWRAKISPQFSLKRHILFWVLMGISVLLKGPPGPLVLGALALSYELLERFSPIYGEPVRPEIPFQVRAIRIASGLLIFLSVTLPWTIAVWLQTDGEFLEVALGRHVVERAQTSLEGHSGPIFYYLLAYLVVTFPLTPLAMIMVPWVWKNRQTQFLRFLLCWFIPTLIVLSLVKTKLPHYMAPLLPAISLAIGCWWANRIQGVPHKKPVLVVEVFWWKVATVLISLAGLALMIAFPLVVNKKQLGFMALPLVLPAFFLACSLLIGAACWWKYRISQALVFWCGGGIVFLVFTLTWSLPALDNIRPSRQIMRLIHNSTPITTEIFLDRYKEPSLMFYALDYVDFVPHNARDTFAILSKTDRSRVLIIKKSEWEHRLSKTNLPIPENVVLLHDGRYFEPNKGRWIEILILWNGVTMAEQTI